MDLNLLSLVPAGGVAGTLVVVIVYLMRQNNILMKQNVEDRVHYMTTIAGVRIEIAELKAVNAQVILELDTERRKRWEAEDNAAHYRRQAGITGDPEP